jgi:hypothetical protein
MCLIYFVNFTTSHNSPGLRDAAKKTVCQVLKMYSWMNILQSTEEAIFLSHFSKFNSVCGKKTRESVRVLASNMDLLIELRHIS